MITREDDGFWLILKETIACGHEEVFSCLTTEGGLMRWFSVGAEIDLAVGGTIRLGWDHDFTKTTTTTILALDAGGRVTWDWTSSVRDTTAPVYWEVSPAVEHGSRVIMRQGPFAETTDDLVAMAEEAESWRWYLCNLRSVLEARHDMRAVRPI